MHRLTNPVMGYAWGSRTAIAELQGREPSAEPQAELWLGAHPKAPSRLADGTALNDFIARDPAAALGSAHRELPFLLKVLAAAEPLSLQAHPSFEQARNGFAKEEALGIPLDAIERNYRDPNPKPELLCALTPFEALSGFRDRADGLAILDAFGLSGDVDPALRSSHDWPAFLAHTVRGWLRANAAEREPLLQRVRLALPNVPARYAAEARWTARLLQLHPRDAGVLVALLLRYRALQPGQALALEAGNLHAYLQGTGIEIMASSDNVLRGGLTPKHIDVDELLRVLRFDLPAPEPLAPRPDALHMRYETPFSQFELHRVLGTPRPLELSSAAIVLVVRGSFRVQSAANQLQLARGESAFVAQDERLLALHGDADAEAFIATVPQEAA